MKHRPIMICLSMVLATFVIVPWLKGREGSDSVEGEQGGSAVAGAASMDSSQDLVVDRKSVEQREDIHHTKHWKREPRPFKVVKRTDSFEWTAEDGKSDEVMKVLSNNSEMLDALSTSNKWVKRRQLVYVNPGFTAKAESVYNEQLSNITLPGFDGEEFEVVIDQVTNSGDYLSGSFTGMLKGVVDADVVAASEGDYWSIGIQLPDRHYQIENREHGEWMVSEIDLVAMDTHFGECPVERSINDVGSVVQVE